jgi:hypothetical protein
MNRKRDHERALFAAFLEVQPDFAGERLAEWQQPPDERDFPDITGTSLSGRRIGVELGEWLNQKEMQFAKSKERIEEHLLEVIGEQDRNPTKHIMFVWLHPKPTTKGIASGDQTEFRAQLFQCIFECDRRWPSERFWQRGHQLVGDELGAYPLLAKYLDAIRLLPANGKQFEGDWITFPARGGPFDHNTMAKPLRNIVEEKIGHYGASRTGFDDLSLVIIYNRAALYNSPAETDRHTFEDAAEELRQLVARNYGPFDRVFLYIALEPGRVFRVK